MKLTGVVSIDLTKTAEFRVDLPSPCNRLWLPPYSLDGNGLGTNAAGVTLLVRINDPNSPQMAWGLTSGLVNSFSAESGTIERLYVTVFQVLGPGPVFCRFETGINVRIGYTVSNLSPSVQVGF